MNSIDDINLLLGGTNTRDIVRGTEAINNMIGNILNIAPGERWWYPGWACKLRRFLYEPVDAITSTSIRAEINSALSFWLPIIDYTVDVIPYPESNLHEIIVRWRMRDNSLTGEYQAQLEIQS